MKNRRVFDSPFPSRIKDSISGSTDGATQAGGAAATDGASDVR